jgi:hypothetical protein
MSRLTQRPKETVYVRGAEYRLNTYYVNCLLTWEAYDAFNHKEISLLALADVAIHNMYHDPRPEISEEALGHIVEYLNKYSGAGKSRSDNRPPLLDLDHDAQFIFDAFMKMGVDLDIQEVNFPKFMALLSELPEGCQLCRIIYLRQQRRDCKLTPAEKKEIQRWGSDIITIKDKRAERRQQANSGHFKEKQNELRAARGLPPL